MTRGFELFVALRYLLARRGQAVIPLVTVVSVAGVAAGVMALVIALAINNGFRQALEQSLLGATPHVVLLEKTPSTGIGDWREITEKAARIPGVREASAALYGKVLVSGPVQSAEATLKSFRPTTASDLAAVKKLVVRTVTAGNLDTADSLARRMKAISRGTDLFYILNNLYPGDTLVAGQKYKIVVVE